MQKIIYITGALVFGSVIPGSAEKVSFVIFANKTSNLLATANKSTSDLTTTYQNLQFEADVYDPSEAAADLLKHGEQLFKDNASIMFYVSGSEKISVFVSNLLKMPAFGIWRSACVLCDRSLITLHSKHATMMPNIQDSSNIIRQMIKARQWKSVGIIYQLHREPDLNILTKLLNKDSVMHAMAGIDFEGSYDMQVHSDKKLKEIADEKPTGIILICDEDKLQSFFDYLREADSAGLYSTPATFVIFDPISTTSLAVDKMFTVLSFHVDMEENMKLHALKNVLSTTSSDVKTIAEYAMLYDAVTSSGKIIADLVSSNRWNDYSGTALEQNELRAANSLEFKKKLETFKDTGLTGNIEFDSSGTRKNMSFQIMAVQGNVFKKVGKVDENAAISFSTEPKANFNNSDQLKVNRHLKIVTIQYAPFLTKNTLANGTVVYSGLLIDIINELAKEANFTYSLYEVADGMYGHLVNGKWTGLVGDVLYKKADMALAAITVTAKRQEVIHFTTPYMEVTIGLVTKKEQASVLDLLLFMEPFSPVVWLLILTACVVVGVFLFSVDYFSPFGWRQVSERATGEAGTEFDIMNSIWFSMASILLQGADNTPRSLSGRILVGCFWFYVLILTSSYTANLAAFFTSTKAKEHNIDLESLLKNGNQFTTVENYALEQFLRSSDYKVYKQVHDRMVIQKSLANSTEDALRRINEDSSMYYLEEKPFIQWTINKKPCELEITETTLPKTSSGFPVRKNAPFAAALSHAISKIQESGFLAQRRHYYMHELSECNSLEPHSHGITSDGRIEPVQMLGAYFFLIGGIFVSVIVLLGEIFWKKKIEERAAKVKQRFRESMRKTATNKMTSLRLRNVVSSSKNNNTEQPAQALRIAVKGFMEGKG